MHLRRDVCLRHVADKKHPFGCLNIVLIKSQNFDGFLGFFVGSENPSVLSVHGFSGSAKTPKRRKIMTFY